MCVFFSCLSFSGVIVFERVSNERKTGFFISFLLFETLYTRFVIVIVVVCVFVHSQKKNPKNNLETFLKFGLFHFFCHGQNLISYSNYPAKKFGTLLVNANDAVLYSNKDTTTIVATVFTLDHLTSATYNEMRLLIENVHVCHVNCFLYCVPFFR